jgi:hypothetical protein
MGQGKVDGSNSLVSMKTEWRLKGCPEKNNTPSFSKTNSLAEKYLRSYLI